MQDHLKNLEQYPHEKLALELYNILASTHSLKSFVTLNEVKAHEFFSNVLGREHPYCKERNEYFKYREE